MYQEGEFTIAKCTKCGETFPVFTFVADTDMVTSGCVALTGLGNKVALTEQIANEADSEIEARIGSGYKIVKVRYIDNGHQLRACHFKNLVKYISRQCQYIHA